MCRRCLSCHFCNAYIVLIPWEAAREPCTIQMTNVHSQLWYRGPVCRTLCDTNNPCAKTLYETNNPCAEPFAIQTTRVQNHFDTNNKCAEPFAIQTARYIVLIPWEAAREPCTIQMSNVHSQLWYRGPVCRTLCDTNNPCAKTLYETNNPCAEPFMIQTTRVQNPLRYKQHVCRTPYHTNNTCAEPFTIQTARVQNPLRYKQHVCRTLYDTNNTCEKNLYDTNSPCAEPFTM